MDPDPGGPKTRGSGGSGSATLTVTHAVVWSQDQRPFSVSSPVKVYIETQETTNCDERFYFFSSIHDDFSNSKMVQ
jgi:hypothetical protein